MSDDDTAAERRSEIWMLQERLLKQFELAWQQGPRPALGDYLLSAGTEAIRAEVLVELVHTDLEYRLKGGEAVRVEEYLRRYPELAGNEAVVLGLIRAEQRLRRRHEPGLAAAEYLGRFPEYAAELQAEAASSAERPTVATGPASCPRCGRPLEPAGAAGSTDLVCLHCQTTVGHAPVRLPDGQPDVPARLGKYELLEVVGRGGFGVVYRARDTELDRTVAVKLPRAGGAMSDDDRNRFLREARTTAQLRHPFIVAVYDTGQLGTACYLVSEFVSGQTLAERLLAGPLDSRRAAVLLTQVAEALDYAHLHGVVHRDVKPSNIMLDAAGDPHVMDFGLALRDAGEATLTLEGQVLGTPAYMSTEQARGEGHRVDARSDVYSLGAVLYEALTGEVPFHGTVRMLLLKILEEKPPPLRRLNDRVPRDLETITLKCLRKEPHRRYSSAAELAADLRRFLAREPIRARPAGWWERGLRWARRRPAAAALVLVSGLAALALLAGGLWHQARLRDERDRAERNFQRAVGAVDALLTEVADEDLASEPRIEEKRRRLLDKALAYYSQFLHEEYNTPALREKTGQAYRRTADILRLLGRNSDAAQAYGEAIQLLGPVAAAEPAVPAHWEELAECYNGLGEALRQSERPTEARAAYLQALAVLEGLDGEFPYKEVYRQDLARIRYNLGILLADTGRPLEAEQTFARAAASLNALVARNPSQSTYRQHLARSYLNLGTVLRTLNRPADAEAAYRQALRLLEELARDHPARPEYRHELAVTSNNLGNLLRGQRRFLEADQAHRKALGLFARLAADHPSVPAYRDLLANTQNSLGLLLIRTGQLRAAEGAWLEAHRIYAELVNQFRGVPDYQAGLGRVCGNLGWLQSQLHVPERLGTELLVFPGPPGGLAAVAGRLGWFQLRQHDLQTGRGYLEQGIHHLEAALRPNPLRPSYREALCNQYGTLADTLGELGSRAEAAEAYYRAAMVLAELVAAAAKDKGAGAATMSGEVDRAVSLLAKAVRNGYRGVDRLKSDPALEPLRRHPSFGKLLAEAGRPAGG